jgi:hypothetical protein
MAGNVNGERLLTGIINLDDRFRAVSSADRLAKADPMRSFGGSRSGRSPF